MMLFYFLRLCLFSFLSITTVYGHQRVYVESKIQQCCKILELRRQGKASVALINDEGLTPLHVAARSGCNSCIQRFIEEGIAINESTHNIYGESALHLAAKNNHPECIPLLLKYGAHINAHDRDGKTALHVAALAHHDQCLQVLIKNGILIDTQDEYGWTALHLVAAHMPLHSGSGQNKHIIDSLKILIRANAQLNVKGSGGRTPLHIAAIYGQIHAVRSIALAIITRSMPKLLNELDDEGNTALSLAEQHEHFSCATLLTKYAKIGINKSPASCQVSYTEA